MSPSKHFFTGEASPLAQSITDLKPKPIIRPNKLALLRVAISLGGADLLQKLLWGGLQIKLALMRSWLGLRRLQRGHHRLLRHLFLHLK